MAGTRTSDSDRLQELVASAQKGSRRAYDELVTATHEELRLFVAMRATHQAMVDEVVHSTYVRAYLALDRFDGRHSVIAWLKGIARNVAREERRNRTPTAGDPHQVLHAVVAQELNDSIEAEDSLGRLRDAMEHCLQELAPPARRTIERRYRDGQPLATIAAEDQTTVPGVAGILRRARTALRACLSRQGVVP